MAETDPVDSTEPLNVYPQSSPNYSATGPPAGPVAPSNPVYPPPGNPPMYGDVFSPGEKTPGGPPAGTGQPYMMPGPAPVPGPASMTTVNYQAGQTTIIATPMFNAFPITIDCPQCRQHVTTRVAFVAGTLTWVIALVMCFFCLWLGCCLIPFCMDGCQDAVHSCPNCQTVLGTYRRM